MGLSGAQPSGAGAKHERRREGGVSGGDWNAEGS